MPELKCPRCSHQWVAETDISQRLIFCPGCSTLVPVAEASITAPAAGGANALMTGVLPFSLEDLGKASEPMTPSNVHRETEGRLAVLLMELADVGELKQNLPEAQFNQVIAAAKRVFRYAIQQYGGREVDKSRGLLVLFPRPIDATRFSLNLVTMMEKTSREIGVVIKARVGIDIGTVRIVESSVAEVSRGARPIIVSGGPVGHIHALAAAGHPGQVLMSRAAWENARLDAGNSVPPNTRWLNHGISLSSGEKKLFEICEVGLAGISPLARPGEPLSGKGIQEEMTLLGGLQAGADALGKSLTASGSSRNLALHTADLPSFSPEHLEGKCLAQYRMDKLLREDRKAHYYLAHDLQLERDVQLKILRKSLAGNHEELIRFLREGVAATYISHPNILAAHETGSQDDLYYIVYENFDGTSLGDLVEGLGKVTPRVAAGHVLQAARGVAAAHKAGIVHRDVNPANLLLNNDGKVRVCGLYFSKIRSGDAEIRRQTDDENLMIKAMANVTEANVALGTPAYISPEQARDATSVDFAADQYSLGCVFHFLLTGQPPFPGNTTMEVMASRTRGALTPPHERDASIPPDLSGIVVKLLAEDPKKRYPSIKEMIAALEAAVGLHQEGAEGSVEGLAELPAGFPVNVYQELREDQRKYYDAGLARVRATALWGFYLVCLAGIGVSIGLNWFQGVGAFVGLYVLTNLFGGILGGLAFKTTLFMGLRRAAFILPWPGKIFVLLMIAGFTYFLYATGLLLFWTIVSVISLVLAVLFQFGIVLPLRFRRAGQVASTLDQLKGLRASGYSEEDIAGAVYAAGGRQWEEFFEQVFGYNAMIAMRALKRREGGARRRKFAPWRDPLFGWVAMMEAARKTSLNQTQLAKAELKRLKMEGMGEEEARKQARAEAQRMLEEERKQFAQPAANDQTPALAAGTGGVPLGRPVDSPGGSSSKGDGNGLFFSGMTGLRTILGSAIILAFLGPTAAGMAGVQIPPNIIEFLQDYYSWGWGGTLYTLAIGGVVLANATSRRYVSSIMGMIGALMLIGTVPIVLYVNESSFDYQTCVFFGVALMVLSLGTRFLRRLTSPRSFLPF